MPLPLSAQRAAKTAQARSEARSSARLARQTALRGGYDHRFDQPNTAASSALQQSIPTPANSDAPTPTWTTRRRAQAPQTADKKDVFLRRYDVMWLQDNGDIDTLSLRAPVLPTFEAAFNAFGRGTLIQTDCGPVAVEDLLPGARVETAQNEWQRVMWIGATNLDSEGTRAPNAQPEKLYRLNADRLGAGPTLGHALFGTGARYLLRADALISYLGTNHALAPIPSMVDSIGMCEITPISTVRSYHLCLETHATINIGGMEIESYHPGLAAAGQLQGQLRAQFMEMFPHLDTLGDFGAMVHPRLTPTDLIEIGAL